MGELAVLGLSDDEERVYDALVAGTHGQPARLAAHLGVPARRVNIALHALVEHGLVVTHAGDALYSLCPVEPAIDALIHAQQESLAKARTRASLLARDAVRSTEHRRPEELVAVVVGARDIRAQWDQLQRSATRVVMTFDRPPYVTDLAAGVNPIAPQQVAAGVEYRTVYDRALLDDPAIFDRIRREVAGGEQGRVLADLPLKLAIADRTMALLPLIEGTTGSERAALIIRPSVLLDSLIALFEALWRRAVPIRLGLEAADLDASDPDVRRLIGMLAAGLKDEAIAHHLRVSERTIRRKVSAALESLGVETRTQAVLRARELGWL